MTQITHNDKICCKRSQPIVFISDAKPHDAVNAPNPILKLIIIIVSWRLFQRLI